VTETGFFPLRPGLVPGSVHVGFVVEELVGNRCSCIGHHFRTVPCSCIASRYDVWFTFITVRTSNLKILSHDWLTIDWVWIGNWNYWTHTESNYEWLRQSQWFIYFKDQCNYSTHKVVSVFNSRCLVAASNDGRSPSSWLRNCPRPQLPASHFWKLQFSTDSINKSKSELFYDRRSVGQFVSVSSPVWGPRSDFCYCHTFAILLMGHSLWREDGSIVYNFCWSSSAQSFSGPSPAGLMTVFYCLRFETPPNLEGQVPVFIFPRHRVAQLYPQALRSILVASSRYIASVQTAQEESLPLLCVLSLLGKKRPQSRSLATAVVLPPVYTTVTWQWVYLSIQ
jgi:hypothetical protein